MNAPKIVIREEIFTFRSRPDTVLRVIAEGPWTGGDLERLYDHLRLMLELDCFEPAPRKESQSHAASASGEGHE